MEWAVWLDEAFDPEFDALPAALQDELLAALRLLADYGPALGRPHADTVKGSRYRNMKELRIAFRGEPWRFLFAFDPVRAAVVLCGGNKAGDKRFYHRHLRVADARFEMHLRRIAASAQRQGGRS